MSEEHRNLILAIVLSMLILFLFHFFYEVPRLEQEQATAERQQQLSGEQVGAGGAGSVAPTATADGSVLPQAPGAEPVRPTDSTVTTA